MSDTASPTPTSSEAPSESLSSALDSFFSEPATEATPAPSSAESSDATERNNPAPTQATAPETPPAVPTRKSLKVKIDHQEQEIDETWFSDETKAKQLKEWAEKGYGHDRVVQRTAAEKFAEGQRKTAQELIERGFTFKPKVANPQTLADFDIVPPHVATPAAVNTASPAIDDAEKALETKALDGDPKAVLELAELRAKRLMSAEQAERTRVAQEAQRETQRKQYEQTVEGSVVDEINARAKSFEGVPDQTANEVRSMVWTIAREAALRQNATPDVAKQYAQALLNHIDGMVTSRVKHLTATAAPAAPPVVAGTPASSKNPALSRKPSVHDNDWFDAALEEASSMGRRR